MAKTVDRRSSEGGIQGEHRLGVSRPDLPVTDLPSPEEVFEVDKLGTKEIFRFALGPSLIALGLDLSQLLQDPEDVSALDAALQLGSGGDLHQRRLLHCCGHLLPDDQILIESSSEV